MFCAKFGRKLSGKECKNCGTSAEIVDRCGGFFGLIDQEAAKTQAAPAAAPTANMVPKHDVEQLLRKQKEEVEEEMKGKALIIVSALCAVLLVVVIILSIAVSNANNKDIGSDVSENAIIDAGNKLFGGDNNNTQKEISDKPVEETCSCPPGTPDDYVPIEGKCKHEVICSGCLARKGLEKCDTADGVACIACEAVPAHDYRNVVDSTEETRDGVKVKVHVLECSLCGEKKTEDCKFDEDGNCEVGGCTNTKCTHTNIEKQEVVTPGTHDEICSDCGETVPNVPSPETAGEKCPNCGGVWTEAEDGKEDQDSTQEVHDNDPAEEGAANPLG